MAYLVSLEESSQDWVAVASGSADPHEISQRMLALIGKVWPFIRASGVKTDGHNIAIYQGAGNEVSIQAGARVLAAFEGSGDVTCIRIPAGTVATTAHIGQYSQLGKVHGAIVKWCAENHRSLTGLNWEVYGHWDDDETKLRTDVYYLVK